MATFRVHQVRSGEGWILTESTHVGPEALASELSDLLVGPVLIASEEFAQKPPAGGTRIDGALYSFTGDAAKAMLRDWKRWGSRRAIVACVPALPDDDAKRRWIPDVLRPWDAERLKATAYAQLGKEWAQSGVWFATERDRSRYVELAVKRVLADASVRLPNGDVTLVLEIPTDSTFDAVFDVSGGGDSLALKRDFASQQLSRTWSVRKGEWEAVEKRTARSSPKSFRERFTQGLATTGIVVVSIPVFMMVIFVALVAKVTGSSTTVSTSAKATTR